MRKLSMKQISLIVSICVFTILFVAVLIILNFTRSRLYVDVLKNTTNVGLILNGPANDRSWSQAHAEALDSISEKLNLNVICRENVPADDSCTEAINSLIDEGCLVILATTYGYMPYVEKAAAEHPNVCFMHATGTESSSNVCSYFGRMYQMRYLCGIIAGTQTKTNSIGYIASSPVNEVNRGINAFTLGVRSVNPDAVVHVRFTGSWTDDAAAEKCTEDVIAACNADIITTHTDSLKPLEVADKHGILSIGSSYDNTGLYPNSCITSCVWKWGPFYEEQILAAIQGKFRGSVEWLGIESGIADIVDTELLGKADPAYKEPLKKARESFENFSFDAFYGPVTDNSGNIRVGEGESMSDDSMLNDFDWYVEGVEIEH